MAKDDQLLITEIFYSLQGESSTVGIPTIFIRLTGCPLRCQYCDTEYAFTGGEWTSFSDIIAQLKKYDSRYITVTGGEPLAQKNCIDFLQQLCDLDYNVSLETSGAIDISQVDARVMKVMDIKTPASQEADKNRFDNLRYLDGKDQIKLVICDRDDYDWAKRFIDEHSLTDICEVLVSPSHEQVDATELADWVLQDHLHVRMQLQLHKILWGGQPGT